MFWWWVSGKAQEEAAAAEKAEQRRLRYLEFVHVAAVQVVLWVAGLYGYAKDRAGPLKPLFQTAEGSVLAVFGPVYCKYGSVPYDLLRVVDRKVGESVQLLDRRLPSEVKEAAVAFWVTVRKVQQAGLVGSALCMARLIYGRCKPAAKELYAKYEPAAEQAAASAWRLAAHRLPLLAHLVHLLVPTAVNLAEKYNEAIRCSASRGYAVATHLPFLPADRIARFFAAEEAAAKAQ
ncbi:hypothetical protein Cni_G27670 [Canna indica]|uniref:Uncharacterized protein n=1 Tax=Canna indica TaxID=4628 RepID=A0AAQ3L182_9LILI|nr:hypothetical protein Cni_G27670 [Canna indica]